MTAPEKVCALSATRKKERKTILNCHPERLLLARKLGGIAGVSAE